MVKSIKKKTSLKKRASFKKGASLKKRASKKINGGDVTSINNNCADRLVVFTDKTIYHCDLDGNIVDKYVNPRSASKYIFTTSVILPNKNIFLYDSFKQKSVLYYPLYNNLTEIDVDIKLPDKTNIKFIAITNEILFTINDNEFYIIYLLTGQITKEKFPFIGNFKVCSFELLPSTNILICGIIPEVIVNNTMMNNTIIKNIGEYTNLIFNPQSGMFKNVAQTNTPRFRANCCRIGNNVMIVGGYSDLSGGINSFNYNSETFIEDSADGMGMWTELQPYNVKPQNNTKKISCLANNSLLITNFISTFDEVYNLSDYSVSKLINKDKFNFVQPSDLIVGYKNDSVYKNDLPVQNKLNSNNNSVKLEKYQSEFARLKLKFGNLINPCSDIGTINYEEFEQIGVNNFFILINAEKTRSTCVEKDWLNFAKANVVADWVQNKNAKNIDSQGRGGKPGNKRFYPITAFGFRIYIDESSFKKMYEMYYGDDSQVENLFVFQLSKPTKMRLGNIQGIFSVSGLHGQTSEDTFSISMLD